MDQPQTVELRTMEDAIALLDEWIKAYERLEFDLERAQLYGLVAVTLAENFEAIAKHYKREAEKHKYASVPF